MNGGLSLNTFLNALILLVGSKDDESLDLVNQLIDVYQEEIKMNKGLDTVLARKFLALLKDLRKIPRKDENDIERVSLIADFLTNNKTVEDQDALFFDSMKSIFEASKNTQGDSDFYIKKKKQIKNTLTWARFKRMCARMYGQLNEFLSTTDEDQQADYLSNCVNVARKLVDSVRGDIGSMNNGAEERVIFSDDASLKAALEKALASEKGGAVLKTGMKGLNTMLGKRGGFVRGEWVIIYGLSHHFKTGLLLSITRGIAKNNDPTKLVKPGKKPLILLVSLENYANRNLLWFYKTAYACTFNKPPDPEMSMEDMIHFIKDFYVQSGWEFIIERYKGMNFGYDEYVSTIEKYEALGYEVVVAEVDYMEKMKKTSSIFSGEAESHTGLTALADGLFGYNKSKEILFISPHQFNRKMQELADRVKTNVVKHFSADGVGGAISINQIADLEIYVYIEQDFEKNAWLTVQRGKHRYVDDTPVAHRYFAQKFDSELGILDDIDLKEKYFVRDIYANDSEATEGSRKGSKPDAYAKPGIGADEVF